MMGNHWNDSNRSKMFDAIGLTFGTPSGTKYKYKTQLIFLENPKKAK